MLDYLSLSPPSWEILSCLACCCFWQPFWFLPSPQLPPQSPPPLLPRRHPRLRRRRRRWGRQGSPFEKKVNLLFFHVFCQIGCGHLCAEIILEHGASKGAFFSFSRRLLCCPPPSILDPTQSKKFPHIPRIAAGKKVFFGQIVASRSLLFLARLIDSGVFPYFSPQWPSPRLTLLPLSPTFWPSRPLRYGIHYRTITTWTSLQ